MLLFLSKKSNVYSKHFKYNHGFFILVKLLKTYQPKKKPSTSKKTILTIFQLV